MDFHLERRLRLRTEPEHKSLYRWAINEIDAQEKQVGHDQIPWPWTLSFTATSCVLNDSIEIKSPSQAVDAKPAPPEIAQRQVIRARLRAGSPRDDEDFFRETTFSMFGTDRAIESFDLEIHPISDPARQQSCTAWGSPSYTAEIDFRHETTDDCIVFYLFVKPDTFGRYATMISDGSLDELIFGVGSVDGFYSEWSPSISTRSVKVLTRGEEHAVILPPGLQFEPPRLGNVGEASLYLNRRLEFGKRVVLNADVEEPPDSGTVRIEPRTEAPGLVDARTLRILGSLRRAAWSLVSLLVLIFAAILLK